MEQALLLIWPQFAIHIYASPEAGLTVSSFPLQYS